MGKLQIIISLSPFQNELVDHSIKIANAALDKGHIVSMFLYMDGVYNMTLSQNGDPFKMESISQRIRKLIQRGITIKSCKLCKMLRGVQTENMPPEIEATGTADLNDEFTDADAVLTFNR